jgi:hypothetical protein
MVGINTYSVAIVFYVKGKDDDEARDKVTETLAHDSRYDWAWIYTTLNKGESNE